MKVQKMAIVGTAFFQIDLPKEVRILSRSSLHKAHRYFHHVLGIPVRVTPVGEMHCVSNGDNELIPYYLVNDQVYYEFTVQDVVNALERAGVPVPTFGEDLSLRSAYRISQASVQM